MNCTLQSTAASMRRFTGRLNLTASIVLCYVMAGNCQDENEAKPTTQNAQRQLSLLAPQKTKDALKKSDIAALFEPSSPKVIRELLFDSNDAVALCAAWKRLESEMAAVSMHSGAASKRTRLPSEASGRFLAFVEGRLHVPVPEGWSRSITEASYSSDLRRTLFVTDWERLAKQSKEIRQAELPRYPAAEVKFSRIPGQPTLEIKSGGLGTGISCYSLIADEGPDWLRIRPSESDESLAVTGIANEDRAFFLNPDNDRLDIELICQTVRRNDSAKILWRKKLDPSWIDDKGVISLHSELRLVGDTIYVFHCTQLSVGIEALNVENGQRIFSFNSTWTVQADDR